MTNPRARRRRTSEPVQLNLVRRTRPGRRGGARPGAGRKPGPVRPTPHRARPLLASRYPVHVTLRVDDVLPDLREEHLTPSIEECLRKGKGGDPNGPRGDRFRLVHYSIMSHHLHLLVEAANAKELTEGIRGLSIRLAHRINKHAQRRGRVFVDRYFARVLRTPREVRNALAYVLLNCRRHSAQYGRRDLLADWIDQSSSGRFFDGWKGSRPPTAFSDEGFAPHRGASEGRREQDESTVAEPGTWLLSAGWRRWGLIRVDEVPGPEP